MHMARAFAKCRMALLCDALAAMAARIHGAGILEGNEHRSRIARPAAASPLAREEVDRDRARKPF